MALSKHFYVIGMFDAQIRPVALELCITMDVQTGFAIERRFPGGYLEQSVVTLIIYKEDTFFQAELDYEIAQAFCTNREDMEGSLWLLPNGMVITAHHSVASAFAEKVEQNGSLAFVEQPTSTPAVM